MYPYPTPKRQIYAAWAGMKRRCYDPSCNRYKRYGARGIVVCEEWLNSFETFHVWSLQNGHAIDRIDNDKGYSPDNCRWATTAQQAANRSTTRVVTFKGETLPLPVWAERSGITAASLHRRIFIEGWDIDRAMTAPVLRNSKKHTALPRSPKQSGRPTPAEKARAKELAQAGHNYIAIAYALGRSPDWARREIDPEYRRIANERSAARMRAVYASHHARALRNEGAV